MPALRIVRVIPRRVWIHTSGVTASLYGAHPAQTEAEEAEWRIEERGWTVGWADGRIGSPSLSPSSTREEAETLMWRVNSR